MQDLNLYEQIQNVDFFVVLNLAGKRNMSDRPVHAGAQLLVGAVGCRRQGGLGWAEVLEA